MVNRLLKQIRQYIKTINDYLKANEDYEREANLKIHTIKDKGDKLEKRRRI